MPVLNSTMPSKARLQPSLNFTGSPEKSEGDLDITLHPKVGNLIGYNFGRLTVIGLARIVKGNSQWRCLCVCGAEAVVSRLCLVTSQTQSCGCLQKESTATNMRHNRKPSHLQPIGVGDRQGALLVLAKAAPRDRRNAAWVVQCDCGKRFTIGQPSLRSGAKSCGCLGNKATSARNFKHGRARSPEHNSWAGMKARCYNPKTEHYAMYGGRGIRVCDAWRQSFIAFFSDMGLKPSAAHSLDRYPDPNGDYEPGNCRWATAQEQIQNTRRVIRVKADESVALGADPGNSGALSLLRNSGEVETIKLNQDDETVVEAVRVWKSRFQHITAFIESVHAFPGQGLSSTFNFGRSYGFLVGMLLALKIRVVLTSPQRWQTAMGCARPKVAQGEKKESQTEHKNRTKARAQELFPEITITHAIADSLLIAEYGRRLRAGELGGNNP